MRVKFDAKHKLTEHRLSQYSEIFHSDQMIWCAAAAVEKSNFMSAISISNIEFKFPRIVEKPLAPYAITIARFMVFIHFYLRFSLNIFLETREISILIRSFLLSFFKHMNEQKNANN